MQKSSGGDWKKTRKVYGEHQKDYRFHIMYHPFFFIINIHLLKHTSWRPIRNVTTLVSLYPYKISGKILDCEGTTNSKKALRAPLYEMSQNRRPLFQTARDGFTSFESSRPLQHISIDYVRPFNTLNGEIQKRWICLITCLTTRAVHLEVVSE